MGKRECVCGAEIIKEAGTWVHVESGSSVCYVAAGLPIHAEPYDRQRRRASTKEVPE